ncbi:MAG: SRPBCC domain-containing protein, partial [Terracidiphilus sp.]
MSQTAERAVAERVLEISRLFNAPRELVYAAWTDPKQLAQWWGPKGFTNPRCEVDVRPGGKIHIDMRAPDGVVYPMAGAFREVIP